MGLLDALFDSGNYGGQSGGLLDLLRTSQMQNSQYQPAAGFAAAPDPAAIPVNAQPTQGQMTQPQTMAPQQPTLPTFLGGQQQGVGFGDRLMAGVQNFANAGGPLQALAGGLSGLVSGSRTDPQGMAQQNLRAQYEALVPTLGPQKAMLAVMNPEAGKTLLQEALTNKADWGVIKDDPITGKQFGWINKIDQTINGKPMGAAGAAPATGTLEALDAARTAGVTGEALYAHLPPQIAPTVKAMIEGRQPLPSTAAMRSPATLALIDAAHAVDPTFDATSWAARQAGAKDFTSGKSSEMVRAANQTLAHVGSLLTAMDNLKNTSFPAANYVGNAVREQLGAGEQGAFRTNAHAVAEEMSKVFKGANLSDAEIRHWEQNLSENMSPAQQKAQIAKLSELLHGSLAALEEKRVAAIGPMAAEKAGPVIKPEGQAVLKRIDEWVNKNGASPAKSALPSGWSVQVR